MIRLIYIVVALLAFSFSSVSQNFKLDPRDNYYPNVLIAKYKSLQHQVNPNYKLNIILDSIYTTEVVKIFPHKQPLRESIILNGITPVDLSLIHYIKFDSEASIEKIINALLSTEDFEYVEPHFEDKPLYDPNDEHFPSMTNLAVIQVAKAWDIFQGDTNVVLGITDTGFDMDHPDLVNSVRYNYNDTIDGIDNDADGFIDNFAGWDLGDNDNDANMEVNAHGVMVAGIASATTDNTVGVASPGFKCKFLPIKVMDASGTMGQSYTGIIYGVDHGCKVINCSWGRAGSVGQFGQDIVNYALYNDVLIVAAAGNDGTEDEFYPASYDGVISVANTNNDDSKYSASNYNRKVDISAPGVYPYKTINGGGYNTASTGTSFSSPLVASAAALVKAKYPDYSAIQIGQILKETSDNIDTLISNFSYKTKLGYGRLNVFNAIADSNIRSISIVKDSLTDNSDNNFQNYDTIRLSVEFLNYFNDVNNVTFKLSTYSPYINLIKDSIIIDTVKGIEIGNNHDNPFIFEIIPGSDINERIELKLDFYDNEGYHRYTYIYISINKDYIDIELNQISTTATSIGKIGFNDELRSEGLGFNYKGNDLLWFGGFMVGNSSTAVSDNMYGETISPFDNDFELVDIINSKFPGDISDYDIKSIFKDSNAPNSLNVLVTQNTYVWKDAPNDKYVICEYTIKNNGASALNNLYSGVFSDFDIFPGVQYNVASYDSDNKVGYTYPLNGAVYAGVKAITDAPVNFYGIENGGTNGSIFIYDGVTDAEKFTALSTPRLTTAISTDVSQVISAGPYSIDAGDSVVVAFAWIAADNFSELIDISKNIEFNYRFTSSFTDTTNITCFGDSTGSATITPKFGREPYTYLWNDSKAQTDSIATNLSAGLYKVTVTDNSGNTRVKTINITQPDIISINITDIVQQLCLTDSTASAKALTTGGNGLYTYIWNDINSQTTETANNLYTGNFSVTVSDYKGCTDSSSVIINNKDALKNDITGNFAIGCKETCTGVINANTTGGVLPYNYSWNLLPTNNSSSATNLCIGKYIITVTDDKSCEIIDTVDIINATPPVLNVVSLKEVSCNGLCDGIAIVSASSGTPPYNYLWENGKPDSIADFLCKGEYKITITDDKKCSDSTTIEILEPNVLNVIIDSISEPTCFGFDNGSAFANTSGGTLPYSFKWNDYKNQNTQKAIELKRGVYIVEVSDSNNCINSDTISISEPTKLDIEFNLVSPKCYGDTNGNITAIISGGTTPYTMLWEEKGIIYDYLPNLKADIYTFNLLDSNNCNEVIEVELSQPEKLSSEISSQTNLNCFGICNGRATIGVTGGVSPYKYNWTNTGDTNSTAGNLCQGIYKTIITDLNNCKDSINITINQPEKLALSITRQGQSEQMACDGKASVQVTGGEYPYSYLWGNGTTDSCATDLCNGFVEVLVIDANYCTSDTIVDISVGINELNNKNNIVLFQNSPNPVTNITNIGFIIPEYMNIELKLIDVLGNNVEIIDNKSLNKGEYKYQINLSHLKSGIYYYTLKAGDYYLVKKLVKQ